MTRAPGPMDRLAIIVRTRQIDAGEKLIVLSLFGFIDGATCECWPSIATIVGCARLGRRNVQDRIKLLVDRGVVTLVTKSRGGIRANGQGVTNRYRINFDALRDEHTERRLRLSRARDDVKPRTPRPQTAQSATLNGAPGAHNPTNEPIKEPTTNNTSVVASLSSELRNHPNATPDRLAWIERDAPSKANPGAWAATCIRNGWAVPPPTPEQASALAKAERERRLAEFDTMPSDEQASILASAYRLCSNLAGRPASCLGVRGAILKVLESRR